ncbi:MAG: peptide-binding protein [Spirochaetia bacterium]|nr:peptide-binding protein [Spirochaetia bacterium]
MKKTNIVLCLCTVSFVLSLYSCKPNPKYTMQKDYVDRPAKGDTLIEASIGEPTTLNPVLASDNASFSIIAQVFNGLVRYDKNIKLEGDLAEKWTVSPDNKTLTFKLRRGVKFHDGVELTSKDVRFTYEKYTDPAVKTAYRGQFELVDRVETPDDYTFIAHYKKPFAPALESWSIAILPMHLMEKGDFNTSPFNRAPVGTGPYVFKKWVTNQKIELQANKDYYEGEPNITGYSYRVIPDQSVQFMNLQAGNIDAMELNADLYLKKCESPQFKENFNKYSYAAFRYTYIGYNLSNPLFKSVNVRRALSYAINRDEIIDGIYGGLARPLTGPFIPGSWAYNNSVAGYGYDLEKSEKLLAQEGWKKGSDGVLEKDGVKFSFILYTNQGNKEREQVAAIAQQQWGKLGINVRVRVLAWNIFITEFVDKRKFDAIVMGWSLSRDPDCYDIWSSEKTKEGEFNFIGYKNSEVDALLDEARSVYDINKRAVLYKKAHALIASDCPYTFLYTPLALSAYHKRFHGITVDPAGIGYNFIRWYVPLEIQKYK